MTDRKLFTAELQRMKTHAGKADAVLGGTQSSAVMKALEDIRNDIRALEAAVKGEEAPQHKAKEPAFDEVVTQKQAEVQMLKTELRALAVCIEQTKSEIAQLRPQDADDDRIIAVTYELDAIVSSTEGATQQILEAAEKIESKTREIQAHGSDKYVTQVCEDINETVITLFEACNFQDITGQRITKVVRTLKYIEARVNAMIDIWGPDNIAEIVPKKEEPKDDESKLLNGPALDNQGISQADIDALFG